jgi:hypothetical protein
VPEGAARLFLRYSMAMIEELLEGGGRNRVVRIGDTVHRQTGPWARTVHALLRHLEAEGFDGAPRVIGSGFDDKNRETLSFIEGATPHRYKWAPDRMAEVGALVRRMHEAAANFVPPKDAVWRDWFGRDLGGRERIIGHCDTGPWNIVARDGAPVALIDWEEAGPVDPLIELAQTGWLNAQLYDEDIATRDGLGDAVARARDLRAIVDGYGLARAERHGFVELMIDFAVHAAANEARLNDAAPGKPEDVLGAVAWRTRSASWMLTHRVLLENALR